MPNHLQLDALSLDTVRDAITAQLNPTNIEVSLCGDMSTQRMQELVLTYLGTVPSKTTAEDTSKDTNKDTNKVIKGQNDKEKKSDTSTFTVPTVSTALPVRTLGTSSQLGIFLPDSEERAMGYLAGPAPNRYGRLSDGSTLYEKFVSMAKEKEEENKKRNKKGTSGDTDSLWSAASDAGDGGAARWKDPLFAHTALLVLQEVSQTNCLYYVFT